VGERYLRMKEGCGKKAKRRVFEFVHDESPLYFIFVINEKRQTSGV
jgi:hypothetical protein